MMSNRLNSFLLTLATGALAVSLLFVVGIPLNNAQQGAIAKANTAAVLQATATHIAELKQDHLVISTTIQDTPDQIVSNDSAGIPLHEAPTAQVEALAPATIYPQPLQPTSTNVPPGVATVNANIDTQRSTGTPMATDTATSTPLAFPISTITPTPIATSAEDLAVIPVATELLPTATFAATLTIEPPPTPAPTDAPKATIAPTPTNTVEPTQTPVPIPTETATQAPTVEPSATSVLISPIATPTIEETTTAVP